MSPLARRHARLHVITTLAVALAFVVVALSLPTSGESRTLTLRQQNELTKMEQGLPHVDLPGMPFHVHDARFNDALARGGEQGKETADPTTAAEARRSASYVASERRLPDPKLTTMQVSVPRLRTATEPLRHGERLLQDRLRSTLLLQGHRPGHLPALQQEP